jgi:cellulose synthase/poly-beta-1,6-N-acetylglucosamine synthase-like glycosyltransferase
MTTLALIIFWASVLGVAHTYILYPQLLRWLARGRQPNADVWPPDHPDLPRVAILMSVYNEEKVLAAKLDTLLQLRYPHQKIRVFIGSDCSSDASAALAQQAQQRAQLADFQFFDFKNRRGKPPVINDLARLAQPQADVLLLTDASVMLHPDALYHLVKHFRNPRIGAVDAHMQTADLRDEGISRSEDRYLGSEVRLKHHESLAWGQMIGPFGGCYALRADLFEPIPPNSLVDDFWLVFRVLERGFAAINDLDALCFEGATHRVEQEYRRKKRIATGSFQNLARFRRWVLPPTTTLGFAFFSHKVLRWVGGFLFVAAWLAAGYLGVSNQWFRWVFGAMTLGAVAVPTLDWVLSRMGITWWLLRGVAYFLSMNVALMHGCWTWLRGVQGSVWQRTER